MRIAAFILLFFPVVALSQQKMMFGDTSRRGVPFSKYPHIFKDTDGRTYLFFQGNNDKGRTWYISNIELFWNENGPYLR